MTGYWSSEKKRNKKSAGGIIIPDTAKEKPQRGKIVAGGGVALVRCFDALDKRNVSGEDKNGINLLKKAIGEPLKHIAVNAGHEGSVVLRKVISIAFKSKRRGRETFPIAPSKSP